MNLTFINRSPFVEFLSFYTKISTPGIVLFGHGVTQKIIDPEIQRIQLSYNDLVNAVDFLEQLNYRFISMEEFQDISISKSRVNYPWVHLTFDDGYKNNLTELYPYLKQKNIPFTIFASINHIINNVRFDNFRIACAIKHTVQERSLDKIAKSITAAEVNRSALIHLVITHYKYLSVEIKRELLEEICQLLDEKEWVQYNEVYHSENVLSVDELKQLSADPMVHIGSHGYNHYIQTTLSEKERMFELEQSKDLLQQLLGKKISTYCYPNGGKKDFSEETEASCTKANYTHCFTTIAGSWKPDGNLMQIPRFPLTYSHLPQIAIKAPVT